MKKINGKEIKKIFEELAADLPVDAIEIRDYDKMPYISATVMRQRLNDVVGAEHYNEEYTEPVIEQAKDTLVVKTKCTVTLLDDDFEPIIVKVSSGGSTIAFPKVDKTDENGNTVKVPGTTSSTIPNDFDSACQDAFKRVCKKCFLIGEKQLREMKEPKSLCIKLNKKFNEAKGHLFGGGIFDGKQYNLAIFKNSIDSFKAAFPNAKEGDEIWIQGDISKDPKGNDQIIFKKAGKSPKTSVVPKTEAVQQVSNSATKTDHRTDADVMQMEITTTSKLAERKSYPGNYAFTVLDKIGTKHNVVFPKKYAEAHPDIIQKLVNAETSVKFTIRYRRAEENGTPILCVVE